MADQPPSLQVEIVEDVAGFDGLREEWRGLHTRTVARNVFASYAWVRTWWRHFGEGRSLFLVTVRHGQRLVALAPLELSRLAFGPFSVRALQLIGTAGVPSRGMGLSDRADFLVEPDPNEALDRLIRTIVENRAWDVLLLRGVPESSPTLDALESALAGDRVIRKRHRRSSSFVLELPGDWDAFVASQSAKWRKTYRAQTNRAERSGRVDFERLFPCSPQELQKNWETVVGLQRNSWKSERGTGLMQLDALEAFFRDVAAAAAEEKLLDLTIARFDGKPFAYEMYLSTPETAGAYDGAYHREMAHLSPGILITGFLVRNSIERGMKAFDFMRGDEPYKQRWGGQELHEEQLAAYRSRRPGVLAAMTAIEGKTFLKRFPRIEQLSDRATGAWVKWKTRRSGRP